MLWVNLQMLIGQSLWSLIWNPLRQQTLEELPLDTESSSQRLHSRIDSTGLSSPAPKGPQASPTFYSMTNGDYNGPLPQSPGPFMGSPRNSKSRRHSESSIGGNGVMAPTANGPSGQASAGAGYPTISKS